MLTDSVVFCRFFFFFQAEDGIRDGHVTGVQTCALPISEPRVEMRGLRRCGPDTGGDFGAGGPGREIDIRIRIVQGVEGHRSDDAGSAQESGIEYGDRSEERRVGKEWRSWVRRYRVKNIE